MCGIVGYIDFDPKDDVSVINKMVATMNHRGPDDSGSKIWKEIGYEVAFGQARLSVIDLSEGGHQPMSHRHLSIVFNGEIYNYKEIRKTLETEGHQFNTKSDTEVILHAYEYWGVACVDQLIGMFSIVIYDQLKHELVLFRDRAGVKPLFIYREENLLLFGSELKAFHVHNRFKKDICPKALREYMQYGYVPAPLAIFKNAAKIEPGTIMVLSLNTRKTKTKRYWDVHECYQKDKKNIEYHDAKQELHKLLKSACNYRMVSDVPVGVFLSGGYDSTVVTALLQSDRTEKIKTFTIGFEEGNNEAPYARETAAYLGTDHTEYICTTKEAQNIIPDLPYYYDEPFGDSSAIPTILVSQVAKKSVTVALSADGGDEVFAGYNSYGKLKYYQDLLNKVPKWSRRSFGNLVGGLEYLVPKGQSALKHKLHGISGAWQSDEKQQAADLFTRMGVAPYHLLQKCFASNNSTKADLEERIETGEYNDLLDPILARDYRMYLQNDILTKVDRATMSVSLEGREPLVDHRLIEYAATLPIDFKSKDGNSKRILKDIVHEYVPSKMLSRPKSGFSLPIYHWLRTDLKELIEEYLSEDALRKSGMFNVPFCIYQIGLFKKNKLHYLPFVWYLLMFQMWYYKWME